MSINSPTNRATAPSFDDNSPERKGPPTTQSAAGHAIPSVDYYATPSPPPAARSSQPQYTEETSIAEDGTPITIQTRRVAATDTIGSIRFNGTDSPTPAPKVNSQPPLSNIGSLPAPRRPDPKTLTGASGTAKIAPPRTVANPASAPSDSTSTDSLLTSSRRKSGIDRIGLSSSIVDASGGTPLCARCQRPVYFAEQKAAAGRNGIALACVATVAIQRWNQESWKRTDWRWGGGNGCATGWCQCLV